MNNGEQSEPMDLKKPRGVNWGNIDFKSLSGGGWGLILLLLSLGASYLETRDNLIFLKFEMRSVQNQITDLKTALDVGTKDMRREIQSVIDIQNRSQNEKIEVLNSRINRLEDFIKKD